jgi:crossover junction endodeoxyribonuclease RuvC
MIMGIDPSVSSSGYAITNGKKVISVGTIKTSKEMPEEERLGFLYDEMEKIILDYGINVIIIEDQFVGKNAKTSLYLARARGVMMLLCYKRKVKIKLYSPTEVKKCLTGKGNASKEEVQTKAIEEYKDSDVVVEAFKEGFIKSGKRKNDDISDALAIIKTYEIKG